MPGWSAARSSGPGTRSSREADIDAAAVSTSSNRLSLRHPDHEPGASNSAPQTRKLAKAVAGAERGLSDRHRRPPGRDLMSLHRSYPSACGGPVPWLLTSGLSSFLCGRRSCRSCATPVRSSHRIERPCAGTRDHQVSSSEQVQPGSRRADTVRSALQVVGCQRARCQRSHATQDDPRVRPRVATTLGPVGLASSCLSARAVEHNFTRQGACCLSGYRR
jgi:hypothetical protein